MEFLSEWGYLGLFLAAFLAATILPVSSELVLSYLLLNDFNFELLILIATVGNLLGALVNYAIGYAGGPLLAKRVFKMRDDAFEQAKSRFQKYGIVSLFFAWVPVIGDPLTVVAGVLRVRLLWFILLVTAGKLMRYLVVAFAVLEVSS